MNFSVHRVILEVPFALEARGGSLGHFFPLLLLTTLMDLGKISEIRLEMISWIPWVWALIAQESSGNLVSIQVMI